MCVYQYACTSNIKCHTTQDLNVITQHSCWGKNCTGCWGREGKWEVNGKFFRGVGHITSPISNQSRRGKKERAVDGKGLTKFLNFTWQGYILYISLLIVYLAVPGDGSPEAEDLPGQQPPHQTGAVGGLSVAGDSNVNELNITSV